MAELLKGKCDYVIEENISKNTGNPYKCLKVKFGDYQLRSFVLLNDDQFYIIERKSKKSAE